jgi:hypothetical protein
MAVVNAYTDTLIDTGRAKPLKSHGYRTITCIGSFEVAAADDDGSVYRLDRLPADAIITNVKIAADAITAGTDFDLGFYEVSSKIAAGAAVDKDVLMDGVDLSSGKARGSEQNGLSAVAIGDLGKKIYELLGKTVSDKKPEYDLAITANTVGTAAGTIEYLVEYAIPV